MGLSTAFYWPHNRPLSTNRLPQAHFDTESTLTEANHYQLDVWPVCCCFERSLSLSLSLYPRSRLRAERSARSTTRARAKSTHAHRTSRASHRARRERTFTLGRHAGGAEHAQGASEQSESRQQQPNSKRRKQSSQTSTHAATLAHSHSLYQSYGSELKRELSRHEYALTSAISTRISPSLLSRLSHSLSLSLSLSHSLSLSLSSLSPLSLLSLSLRAATGQRTDSAHGRCGTVASAASDCSSLCDVTEEMKGEVVAVVVITADTNGYKKLLCLSFCHPISGVRKSFHVCQMHLKLFLPLCLKLMVSNKCGVT